MNPFISFFFFNFVKTPKPKKNFTVYGSLLMMLNLTEKTGDKLFIIYLKFRSSYWYIIFSSTKASLNQRWSSMRANCSTFDLCYNKIEHSKIADFKRSAANERERERETESGGIRHTHKTSD